MRIALLAIAAAMLLRPAAAADNDAACVHNGTSSGASMKFYVVGKGGESAPDNPLQSGFASCASSDFSAPPPSKPTVGLGSRQPPQKQGNQAKSSTQTNNDAAPDRYKAAQCERYGFYYTRDNRCVAPVRSKPVAAAKSARREGQKGVLQAAK